MVSPRYLVTLWYTCTWHWADTVWICVNEDFLPTNYSLYIASYKVDHPGVIRMDSLKSWTKPLLLCWSATSNELSCLPFSPVLCSVPRFCCPGGPLLGPQPAGTRDASTALQAPPVFFLVVALRQISPGWGGEKTESSGYTTHHPKDLSRQVTPRWRMHFGCFEGRQLGVRRPLGGWRKRGTWAISFALML